MRKYITRHEWISFFSAITGSSTEFRDKAMFMIAYKHGLRVSELNDLRISDLDLEGKTLYVRRLKNGLSTVHPLQSDTLLLIHHWLQFRTTCPSVSERDGFLFTTIKGKKISRQWIYRLSQKYSTKAGLNVRLHPHMLRHACGYALANQGLDTRLIQDYLGHRNIHHTVHYTASNPGRFKKAWNDISSLTTGK
ncbi:TPA: tyrosine-type recombinase/integrase [Salmonella enterica]|uniref:Tyrosine-type recombinase/integrase n=1 Tax=Salmonella enterica TaxID=28901 RepID=A0A747XGI6_SALER|nr:tyrosine-type recombinase/integrase [Salmonella enterica]HAF4697556.1 tyrosine-type recombinase/integrase [Salmonella enterica]